MIRRLFRQCIFNEEQSKNHEQHILCKPHGVHGKSFPLLLLFPFLSRFLRLHTRYLLFVKPIFQQYADSFHSIMPFYLFPLLPGARIIAYRNFLYLISPSENLGRHLRAEPEPVADKR